MGGDARAAAHELDGRAFIDVDLPAGLTEERRTEQARHRAADDDRTRDSAFGSHLELWGSIQTECQSAVLTIRPLGSTYQRSLSNGLPLSRATSQSAAKAGGNGPRLAAGTLPTECRLSA